MKIKNGVTKLVFLLQVKIKNTKYKFRYFDFTINRQVFFI